MRSHPMLAVLALAPLAAAPLGAQDSAQEGAADVWSRAQEHAALARECVRFSQKLLAGWSERVEPLTGLFPETRESFAWTPENAAADLYAWLVIAADWAGSERQRGAMRQMLATELALTTRLESYPDALDLADLEFYQDVPRRERVLFGASEYAKDGLLPLLEALGPSPWSDRLVTLARDLALVRGAPAPPGHIVSQDAEVNGEILQVLSRVWHFTGDDVHVPRIARTVRAYVETVAQSTGGLPCDRYDFERRQPIEPFLALHDHGNEILGGLVEAALVLREADPVLCRHLQRYLHDVFARIAEHAVKDDGTLVARIDARTGDVIDARTPDTFGYVLLAFLAWSRFGEGTDWTPLVERGLAALVGGTYDTWPDPDSYADAIESAVLLMHRLPSPDAERWVRRTTPKLLALQRPNGLVTGGYADGNALRTARLVGRWLEGGTTLEPRRDDVLLGAALEDGALHVWLDAERPYHGRWSFDHARHRRWLRMPMNLPRLNEDPEWFSVEGDHWYALTADEHPTRLVLGAALRAGLPISLTGDAPRRVRVEPFGPTPPGGFRLRVEGPRVVQPGAESVTVALAHDLPFAVRPRTDPVFGPELEVGPGERVEIVVPLAALRRSIGGIDTYRVRFFDPQTMAAGSWTGYDAPSADVLDVRVLRGDGVTGGLNWRAVGREGLEVELAAAAGAGPLELRWLVPDEPSAQVALLVFADELATKLVSAAAPGAWATAQVPAGAARDGFVRVRIEPRDFDGTLRLSAVALCAAER